jgi:hypothetical protein
MRSRIENRKDLEDDDLGFAKYGDEFAETPNRSRVSSPSISSISSPSRQSPRSVSASYSVAEKAYHAVTIDDTLRLGVAGLTFVNASNLGIPETEEKKSRRPQPKQFFGLMSPPLTQSNLEVAKTYTTLPPYRFSVEFHDLQKLSERERSYSHTHFYAGSWFNVYVQTIKKKDKGMQLGIYLHRHSINEDFPTPTKVIDKDYWPRGMDKNKAAYSDTRRVTKVRTAM